MSEEQLQDQMDEALEAEFASRYPEPVEETEPEPVEDEIPDADAEAQPELEVEDEDAESPAVELQPSPAQDDHADQAAGTLPPTPGTVEINGQIYDATQVAQYLEWVQTVQADPNRWAAIQEVAEGRRVAIPPADFPDEPTDRYQQLETKLARLEQDYQRREQAEVRASLEDGINRFRSQYQHVDDDGMSRIQATAARLNMIQALRDAEPNLSRSELARRAFENAYRIEYFDHRTQEAQRQVVTDMRARKRAAHSAGSSATIPRQDPVPTTPDEIRSAMVAELRDAMNGGG